MPKIRTAVASVAASLLLTAAAEAASVRNPAETANRAYSESSTAVGEPFLPRDKPSKKTFTYSLSCEVTDGYFPNGASVIKMVNTGSQPIPAGAVVEVTFPDGTTHKFTTSKEIKPGGAVSIMGPSGATAENFPCSATATHEGIYIEPGVIDTPSAIPDLPPKLACEFTVVDGKLVVTFKNVGGSPLPAKQVLHAGSPETGYGFSYHLPEDIPPGESIHLVYDSIDPAILAGTDCTATIKD